MLRNEPVKVKCENCYLSIWAELSIVGTNHSTFACYCTDCTHIMLICKIEFASAAQICDPLKCGEFEIFIVRRKYFCFDMIRFIFWRYLKSNST